jgi:hypothetical protein
MTSVTINIESAPWNGYILVPHFRIYIVIKGTLMRLSDDYSVMIIPIQLNDPVFVYKIAVYNTCTTITDNVQLDTFTREEPFTIL